MTGQQNQTFFDYLCCLQQIGTHLVCREWQLEVDGWVGGKVGQLLQTLILFPLSASRSHNSHLIPFTCRLPFRPKIFGSRINGERRML